MKPRKFRKVGPDGKHAGGDPYFIAPHSMIQSKAFRALSPYAVKVWMEIRCRYNGGNNGEIKLSLDEAADLLGIAKSTCQRAFVDLVEKGFLIKMTQGRWYGRAAAQWQITDKPMKGEHVASHLWRKWQPPVNGHEAPAPGGDKSLTGVGLKEEEDLNFSLKVSEERASPPRQPAPKEEIPLGSGYITVPLENR